jgi:hypothetical protein
MALKNNYKEGNYFYCPVANRKMYFDFAQDVRPTTILLRQTQGTIICFNVAGNKKNYSANNITPQTAPNVPLADSC